MTNKYLTLIGYAYGGGGADYHTGEGPAVIKASPYLKESHLSYRFDDMIKPPPDETKPIKEIIAEICHTLALKIAELVRQKQPFVVIGGDHTSGIGTWSGASSALRDEGEVGLIWIDAHMDSHTPETSLSGRIHGMPLAALTGTGYESLLNILDAEKKIKPQNLCLIGVRSFEDGEALYLRENNVRVYLMEEVIARGLNGVLQEAVSHVTQHTVKFGVSFDIDSLDPHDAPAVAVPEPDGISAASLLDALPLAVSHPDFIGIEIAEFNPAKDINHKTEKLVISFLQKIEQSLNV